MDIDVSSHAPEIKAGIGGASAVTHDEVMRLFEEFKAANDDRLGQIERRSADVVTEDKVERINAALTRRLDELTLKSARPSLGREIGISGDVGVRRPIADIERRAMPGGPGVDRLVAQPLRQRMTAQPRQERLRKERLHRSFCNRFESIRTPLDAL